MLGFILFSLKLLGIIVLCILVLILLILLLVLFAPIKYSSEGSKYWDALNVKALVTYLNPIVRVEVHYSDEMIVKVKILFFTVYPRKPKEKKDEQKEKEAQKTGESRLAGETGSDVCNEDKQTKKSEIYPKSVQESAKQQSVNKTGKQQENAEPADESKKSKQERATSDTQSKQGSSKDGALNTIGYYTSLLKENKELIIDVLKTILKAFKTILPRKCNIKAVFGTGRADITGLIYGAYCSLKEHLTGEIVLEPVWTETYIEGEYYIKGKIRLIHFLMAVIKIFTNKRVRLLIKKLRRV